MTIKTNTQSKENKTNWKFLTKTFIMLAIFSPPICLSAMILKANFLTESYYTELNLFSSDVLLDLAMYLIRSTVMYYLIDVNGLIMAKTKPVNGKFLAMSLFLLTFVTTSIYFSAMLLHTTFFS